MKKDISILLQELNHLANEETLYRVRNISTANVICTAKASSIEEIDRMITETYFMDVVSFYFDMHYDNEITFYVK